MSTEFLNDQWRIPNNKNKNKFSNYSIDSTLTTGVNIGSRIGTHPQAMNTPWTISAWIYIPEGTGVPSGSIYNSLVPQGSTYSGIALLVTDMTSSGYGLNIRAWKQNVRSTRYSRVQTTLNSPTGLARGQWHHIVCADDGIGYRSPSYTEGANANSRGWRFYINNVVSTTDIIGNPTLQPLGDVINDIPGDILVADTDNILISDVAFYPTYLEAGQVSTLYGSGTAMGNPMAISPKPLNYWKLSDSAYNGANYLVPNSSLNGYFFNFDNQHMQTQPNTPSVLNGATSLSISAWVRFNTVSSGSTTYVQPIVSNWETGSNQYIIRYLATSSNPELQFYLNDGTNSYIATKTTTLTINTWYLVTGVWDGSNTRIYINFSPGSDVSFSGTLNTSSNSDKIGSYSTDVHLLEGSVLNLGIWKNVALTTTQVEEIYGRTSPTLLGAAARLIDLVNDFSGPDPTVYYKLTGDDDTFDISTGNWVINDSVGNRDADSVGMTQGSLILEDTGFIKNSSYGYSPYALDFDGINDYLDCGGANDFSFTNGSGTDLPFSLSAWINMDDALGFRIITKYGTGSDVEWFLYTTGSGILRFRVYDKNNASYIGRGYSIPLTSYQNRWINVVATYNGNKQESGIKIYINALKVDDQPASTGTYQGMVTTTNPVTIGKMGTAYASGKISNASIFNIELSPAEVTEIYNSNVASNLNTFSGTAPIAWWQIGSNSSFDTNWTCLDEIGTNNAVSGGGMTNIDITNGPGYSGMGIGDSAIKILGNAPYSSANGLSENMDVLDRVSGTGNVPG